MRAGTTDVDDGGALRLAVLGDSIAYGTGASRRADTLAERLADGLRSAGHLVEVEVFAVPGARSAGLRQQVERSLRWRPDVAVFVIGANDLTHLVPPAEAARSLDEAVAALRGAGAEVVVAPAPDLGVVPHVPAALRETVSAGSRLLRQAQVDVVRARGGRIADAGAQTAREFARDRSLFAVDRFHPSSAGYARIAAALLPEVLAAAREAADDAAEAS